MQRPESSLPVSIPTRGGFLESVAHTSWYRWAVVVMLWFICFFNYADRQAIFSIFKLLETEFHFNKAELGAIGSAFALIYSFSAPLAGQVSDRSSRKFVILGGLYVWSLVTGFTALCSKVWQFVLVRAAEGLGETFYFPASMSLVSDYHSTKTRSRAMGFHQTSVYAGTIGGGVLAAWMGENYGWQSPFIVLGAAGIVLGLVLALFIREPARNEAELREGGQVAAAEAAQPRVPIMQFLRDLFSNPSAVCLILAFFGANSVGVVFLMWMPYFLSTKFNLSITESGFSATVYLQVASMIGAMLGGVLADRWRARTRGGRMLVQAMGTFVGAPFIFLCGTISDFNMFIVTVICLGLAKGIYDSNIWASLYDVVPVSRRSTAVGLMNMIGWFGGAVGPFFLGVSVDYGIEMGDAIAFTSVIYLVVAGLLVTAAIMTSRRGAALEPAV